MTTEADAVYAIRAWWSGHWYPTVFRWWRGTGYPTPSGSGIWYAWCHWVPGGSARPDGLADVLGLCRVGRAAEVMWWPIASDGTAGRSLRAVTDNGTALDIDQVEDLTTRALVLERRPDTVRWVEVEAG